MRTIAEIQALFPHRCVGYGCAICWWVDGRNDERKARRRATLARLEPRHSAWHLHRAGTSR